MKNVSKNKFLTCFRPVVDIDAMLDSGAAVDRSDKQNRVVRQPPKRTFSKVIKAVVFETILNSKTRNKNRYGQSCFGSKRCYSAYTESSSTSDEKSTVRLASLGSKIKEINALELSSSSSSSSWPVSESENLSKCKSANKDQLEKQKKFECLGIYAVLISLVVTVFWGKINVIILTSMMFCCFSVWNACSRRLKEVAKLWNTESQACKNSQRIRDHNGEEK
ncbi:hypothetical protein SESBI_34176 [Sesbania bispinosa]|nr:hypothetical protein SESBI_34176 [Sesbania bispinosa]